MTGKLISYMLTHATGLTALVPSTRIFPIVANEDTPLPAIIYTIDGIDPEYDKNRWVQDRCTFSVRSYSGDYGSLQDIALQVREALEVKQGTINGFTINRIELLSQNEGFAIEQGIYFNTLTFEMQITEY